MHKNTKAENRKQREGIPVNYEICPHCFSTTFMPNVNGGESKKIIYSNDTKG